MFLLLIALFAGCKESPTGPRFETGPLPSPSPRPLASPLTGPLGGPLTGTWTGLITYTAGGRYDQAPISGRCPSSETITVDVNQDTGDQVTATFSSKCYARAEFKGRATTSHLTGQFFISQGTCNEEGGYIPADGPSTGSFDTSHIHLQTPELGTPDCGFGGNQMDIDRSH